MKNNIKITIALVIGFIGGIILLGNATTYNSEEISYDNSKSGAEAENVKEAIDYLYSHGSCGSGMSCLESPTVTINIVGDGSVDKNSMIVPISGSNKIVVTPTSPYLLRSVSCTNRYQISEYRTNGEEQEITITNPGIVLGSECSIRFEAPVEVDIGSSTPLHSTYKSDVCNNNNVGCICYYIYNYETGGNVVSTRGQKFTYGSHTGCTFKSTSCNTVPESSGYTDCVGLIWSANKYYWYDQQYSGGLRVVCSGVLLCET